jgi:exodeoxyribonuclease VII small subunit
MSKKTKNTFEESVTRLEELIEGMEDGSSTLDDLVAKYEEGSRILKECQKQLNEAELKIEKLNTKTGEPEPFDNDEETND